MDSDMIEDDITHALLHLKDYQHSGKEDEEDPELKSLFRPINSFHPNPKSNRSKLYYQSPINTADFQVEEQQLPTQYIPFRDIRSLKGDSTREVEQFPISNRLPPLVEQTRCPKHFIVPIIEPEIKGGDAISIDFVPLTFFRQS